MKEQLLQKAKPILFNTEMVKAILKGRKIQTRIPVKIKNKLTRDWALSTGVEWLKVDLKDEKYPYSIREQNGAWNEYSLKDFINKYSQYKVGDFLWVREPARVETWCGRTNKIRYWYQASREDEREIDLPKRFEDIFSGGNRTVIPEWITECKGVPNGCIKEMARIFLRVTKVRVERLQDIKYSDIEKELGVNADNYKQYTSWSDLMACDFKDTWNSTAKDGYKWEDNPFVFVYEFERVEVC